MKKLKSLGFGNELSRNEMKNISGGLVVAISDLPCSSCSSKEHCCSGACQNNPCGVVDC